MASGKFSRIHIPRIPPGSMVMIDARTFNNTRGDIAGHGPSMAGSHGVTPATSTKPSLFQSLKTAGGTILQLITSLGGIASLWRGSAS